MEDDPFIVRVGTFFLVIGAGVLVIFIASDFANEVDFDYLFVAMLLIGVGWMMRSKKAPPPPADRFTWIRGVMGKNKKGGGRVKNTPPPNENEEEA